MDKLRLFAAEAIGTFVLVLIGVGSVSASRMATGSVDLLAVALAFGLVVAAVVAATGHVSGAHINPAVTVSLLAVGKLKAGDAVAYVLSQLVGAALAGLACNALLGPGSAAAGATQLAPSVSAVQGVAIEAILTFILVFVIFGTAVDMRAQKSPALFIGLAVAVDILVGGPYTGASMNPARSFGPAVAGGVWNSHWIYWLGPIIGGTVAALAYTFLFLPRAPAERLPEVRPQAPSDARP
jgi:aquaporin TIP